MTREIQRKEIESEEFIQGYCCEIVDKETIKYTNAPEEINYYLERFTVEFCPMCGKDLKQ